MLGLLQNGTNRKPGGVALCNTPSPMLSTILVLLIILVILAVLIVLIAMGVTLLIILIVILLIVLVTIHDSILHIYL